MSRGKNLVILIGNLGQEPDVRLTQDGTCMANLSIATDESYKDKQTNQIVPRTEWHKCVAAGRLGEICKDYLKKGSKVYIEGKLQTRKWQDQSGQDRYTTEIRVREMQMLDSKNDQNNGQPAPQGAPQQQQQQYQNNGTNQQRQQQQASYQAQQPQQQPAMAGGAMDDFDDDIPFMRLDSFAY